jgi:hypothetical protein
VSSRGRTLSEGLWVQARIGDGTAQRPSLRRESLGRRPGRAESHVLFQPFNGQAAYLPPIRTKAEKKAWNMRRLGCQGYGDGSSTFGKTAVSFRRNPFPS